MNSLEPKKLALIRILQILKKHSDQDHTLTQEEIAGYLERDYGIVVERKSIGRNISLLKEAGYEIEGGRNGSYLAERDFEDSELQLLIDAVLNSRYVTAKHSKDLIEKLCAQSNKYFRAHVLNIHSVDERSKTDNQELFFNIELVDEAIEKNKRITFEYNKYGVDKRLHFSSKHEVSPYQLVLSNQRYYLMACNEAWQKMVFYRLDHITNMVVGKRSRTPIKSVEGYENGINYAELTTGLPYMFTDKLEKITFLAKDWMADHVVDWFGKGVKIEKHLDGLKVTIKASPNAMEYWALQYLSGVEVISPENLRDRIKKRLKEGMEKYN